MLQRNCMSGKRAKIREKESLLNSIVQVDSIPQLLSLLIDFHCCSFCFNDKIRFKILFHNFLPLNDCKDTHSYKTVFLNSGFLYWSIGPW